MMYDMTQERTYGQQIDEISTRMDAAYAERREVMNDPRKYAEADEKIEAVYRDLRILNAEMKGEHITSGPGGCWCSSTVVHVS